jgi:TRAP-type C4-dicarboxylate transport system permease large subunit
MKLSASVFVIIAAAGPFSWLLTRLGTLKLVESWLLGFADTPWLFVVVVVAFIFVIGMVMDAVANIIVLGPLLIDICVQAGFAEVQAALVVIVGFLVGTVTPPIGVAYFTAAQIARAKIEQVALAMIPFILVEVVVLYLMLIIPGMTMWFPKAFGFIN